MTNQDEMNQPKIREAQLEDAKRIYEMIIELAVYEKAPEQVLATQDDIEKTLFCDESKAQAIMVEIDDQVVGYAVYFYNYSTWLGKYGIYLEDLYVTPEFRGKGAGKALFQFLARKAVAEGCGRYEWNVLDWNKPSIDFYEAAGAKPLSEWVGYRLCGEELIAFADRG